MQLAICVIKALCLPVCHPHPFYINIWHEMWQKMCRPDSPPTVLLSDKPSTECFTLLVSQNQKKTKYGGDRDWEKKDNLLSNTAFRSMFMKPQHRRLTNLAAAFLRYRFESSLIPIPAPAAAMLLNLLKKKLMMFWRTTSEHGFFHLISALQVTWYCWKRSEETVHRCFHPKVFAVTQDSAGKHWCIAFIQDCDTTLVLLYLWLPPHSHHYWTHLLMHLWKRIYISVHWCC